MEILKPVVQQKNQVEEDNLTVLPSVFADELLLVERGQHLNLSERPYLYPVYDSIDKFIILGFGRQCEKSTTIANKAIIHMANVIDYEVLYVVPSHPQLKEFSKKRINRTIERSPGVASLLPKVGIQQAKNIYDKVFANGASLHLRVAFLTPDRIRGLRADMVIIDEVQDILVDHLPVILETTQHSDIPEGKKHIFAGTFKNEDDGLGHFWNLSTKGEYSIKCSHCNKWNVEIHIDNIGKKGLICKHCGGDIHPLRDRHEIIHAHPDNRFLGIRVPQLVVPSTLNDWENLLYKLENYPTYMFFNEVLAKPYTIATKPITEQEIQTKVCNSNNKLYELNELNSLNVPLYGGVDWGYGLNSYTVLTILAKLNGKYQIVYIKRFDYADELDPDYQVDFLIRTLKPLRIAFLGVDWGAGVPQNKRLFKVFSKKLIQFFEHGTMRSSVIKWNEGMSAYVISRSYFHHMLFDYMRTGKFSAPSWDQFKNFAKDILAIYKTYNDSLRMDVFDHPVSKPDDFFHSLMYATTVANLHMGVPF